MANNHEYSERDARLTPAERIRRVAALKPADRVPFALLSSGTWCVVSHGGTLRSALELPAENLAGWLHDGYTSAGSDLSWVGSGFNNLPIEALGGKLKWREKGVPDVAEPLLASAGDADKYDPDIVRENPNIKKLYEVMRQVVAKEKGERLTGGNSWGPFTLAGLLFGTDRLLRGVYKDPPAVHGILSFTAKLYAAYVQGYIDAGAKVALVAEPSASGDMISKEHFRAFALPYIQEAARGLSDKGVIPLLHICGDVTDRLDLIAESGVGIMSLDYKVDLAAARDAFAGKLAFAGNMNPVSVVQSGEPEDIKRAVIEGIKTTGSDSSYIVMPGCDIPPTTPLANLQLISETVRGYVFKKSV